MLDTSFKKGYLIVQNKKTCTFSSLKITFRSLLRKIIISTMEVQSYLDLQTPPFMNNSIYKQKILFINRGKNCKVQYKYKILKFLKIQKFKYFNYKSSFWIMYCSKLIWCQTKHVVVLLKVSVCFMWVTSVYEHLSLQTIFRNQLCS